MVSTRRGDGAVDRSTTSYGMDSRSVFELPWIAISMA